MSEVLYEGAARVVYRCDGSGTVFPVPFDTEGASSLRLLTAPMDDSADPVELSSGWSYASGGVTLESAPAADRKLVVMRATPLARKSVYTPGGPLTAASLNADLDRLTWVVQDLRDMLSLTVSVPPTTIGSGGIVNAGEVIRQYTVTASGYAARAFECATVASGAAVTAAECEANASGAMVRAETAAIGVSTYAAAASGAMVRAETAAIGVSTYAVNASGAMVAAQGFANNASTYANNAASYRRNASAYNVSAGIHEAGASGAEVRASAAMEQAIIAGGGLVVVEDSTTVGSAHIQVLSGGTSYRFAHPLTSLTIDNADAHPAECAATFLANRIVKIGCSAYGPLGGTIEPYRYHYLTIRDGVVLAHPVSHQVRAVAGESGVHIYSGAVASHVSGAAWMSGLVLSGMHWRADVHDGGILAAVSLGHGAKTSVYSGGIVMADQMDSGTSMDLCGGRAYFAFDAFMSGGLTVSSGGMAYGTRVCGVAGTMTVSSGGSASSIAIGGKRLVNNAETHDYGRLTVSCGGVMSCAVLESGGTLTVLSGGTAHEVDSRGGTVVSSAGADVTYVTNN